MNDHTKHFTNALIRGAASAALALAASVAVMADGHVAKALQKLDRPAAEIARDVGRKPAEVIEYIGVKPGMKVWDHASSSGYYTALFSAVVGPEGTVYAQNSPAGWERGKEQLEARYAALGNVEAVPNWMREYDGPDGEIDVVFVGLLFHHMHYDENTGEARPDRSPVFFGKAMELLKPGGTLVIIEHQAPDGTSRAESAAWHRASLQNAIDDITASGFEYVGSSDILANPDDPQNIHFRELGARDSSQRFIAKFRKPS